MEIDGNHIILDHVYNNSLEIEYVNFIIVHAYIFVSLLGWWIVSWHDPPEDYIDPLRILMDA